MTPYETVTNRIIAQLEAGIIPWKKTWTGAAKGTGAPRNKYTGKAYRGANFLTLLCSDFSSREWVTYKQAEELGLQVRKGSKGTPIIFWSTFKSKDATGAGEASGAGDAVDVPMIDGAAGDGKTRGFLKTYYVFNLEQCDGCTEMLPFEVVDFDDIEAADALVTRYLVNGGPSLAHEGGAAYYRPSTDSVVMPPAASFCDSPAYYSTLFHELSHSTGHPSRLDREMKGHSDRSSYAAEELLAEFSACFLCVEAGISCDALEINAAAYIQDWLTVFKSDSRIAVLAAQRAQKSVDCILGREFAQAVAA